MLNFQLSFKSKLRVAITLALLGFIILSFISFNALTTLKNTSQKVDLISQQSLFLKNLQIDVLQLNKSTDLGLLNQLSSKHNNQLNAVKQLLPENKSVLTENVKNELTNWANSRVKELKILKIIGRNNREGLRNTLSLSLADIEKKLFPMFNDPFAKIEKSVAVYEDNQTLDRFNLVLASLDAFQKKSDEINFGKIYDARIQKIRSDFSLLEQNFSAMKIENDKAEKAYIQLTSFVTSLQESLNQQLIIAKEQAVESSERAQLMIISVSILIILLVVGLLIRTSNEVVNTLSRMSTTLYKLAEGDLTQKLEVNTQRNDELDKVGQAVNKMTQSLSAVLTQVTKTSEQLDHGATNLSHSLDSMITINTTTNTQAESVAAAAEEISVTILDMASATEVAHDQSQQAQDSANQGGEVITSAIDSLSKLAVIFDGLNTQVVDLESSSGKVDGVTDIINGLAEQTNLLALNAAIEAARAGEAGRGFSVVADEVRGLAEKTVNATQSINTIINEMHRGIQELLKAMSEGRDYVNSGRQLGDKAADAVEQIKSLVENVTNRNQELKVNIDEVAKSTQMIAENMVQVADNVSHVNEKSKEVQEYVSESSKQAASLLDMTQKFRC